MSRLDSFSAKRFHANVLTPHHIFFERLQLWLIDNNCFKNGILPICVDEEILEELMLAAESGKCLSVDLDSQTICAKDGSLNVSFEVEPFRKHCLMNGLDDIGLTLQHDSAITAFEEGMATRTPWL